MTINIIPCKAEQLKLLREISIETYRYTFEDSNSEELMVQYLHEALNLEKLSLEFKTIGSYFYFIYVDEEVAGFLKVNIDAAKSDDMDEDSLEVERFYIRQHYLRRGLGKVLMQFAYDVAHQFNKNSVWLGVWEGNQRALAFYKAQGFYQIGEHPFDMAGDIQNDLVLKKDL